MKTMFTLGLPSTFDFWNRDQLGGDRLGQAGLWTPSGTLTTDQHTAVVAQLKDAIAKATEVDAWIHSGADQKTVMQDWYDDFRRNIDYGAVLAENVYPMYQRLDTPNVEDWYILDTDAWKVDNFLTAVNQAYGIYLMKVLGVTTPITPVAGPKPGDAPRPGTAPAAVARRAPSSGIIPPAKILGIPTKTILVGGGVAVGLGLLFYALA